MFLRTVAFRKAIFWNFTVTLNGPVINIFEKLRSKASFWRIICLLLSSFQIGPQTSWNDHMTSKPAVKYPSFAVVSNIFFSGQILRVFLLLNGIFSPGAGRHGCFRIFQSLLIRKNLHFRCKIVLSSDKTPPSGKITCFSEFYGSDYHIKHIFGRFWEQFFFITFSDFF